jgi:hypothetical protein
MIRHAVGVILRRDLLAVIDTTLGLGQRQLATTSSKKQQGGWASFATVGAAGCVVGVGLQQLFFQAPHGKKDAMHGSDLTSTIEKIPSEEGPLGKAQISSDIPSGSSVALLPSGKPKGPWVQDDEMNVVIHRRWA